MLLGGGNSGGIITRGVTADVSAGPTSMHSPNLNIYARTRDHRRVRRAYTRTLGNSQRTYV